MPVPLGFAQALADYAEAIDDVQPLKDERDALFLRIKSGEAGAIISSELNGKKVTLAGPMTVEEKFSAFVEAVKIAEGTKATTTYGGFDQIDR